MSPRSMKLEVTLDVEVARYILRSGPESVLKLVNVSVVFAWSMLATPLVVCTAETKSPWKAGLVGMGSSESLLQAMKRRESRVNINRCV